MGPALRIGGSYIAIESKRKFGEKLLKRSGNIWKLAKKVVTLQTFCGTSFKVTEYDAVSDDMRTEMASGTN